MFYKTLNSLKKYECFTEFRISKFAIRNPLRLNVLCVVYKASVFLNKSDVFVVSQKTTYQILYLKHKVYHKIFECIRGSCSEWNVITCKPFPLSSQIEACTCLMASILRSL